MLLLIQNVCLHVECHTGIQYNYTSTTTSINYLDDAIDLGKPCLTVLFHQNIQEQQS